MVYIVLCIYNIQAFSMQLKYSNDGAIFKQTLETIVYSMSLWFPLI